MMACEANVWRVTWKLAAGLMPARCQKYPASAAVPVGNLRSEILVMQSAQNRHRQRATHRVNGTRDRRVLVQR